MSVGRREFIVTFIFAAHAFAQQMVPQDPGTNPLNIQRQLYSNSPQAVAWAAWRATSYATEPERWNPLLLNQFANAIAQPVSPDMKKLVSVFLDSFMRTNTVVP